MNVMCGAKYRITDGRYKGRWCIVKSIMADPPFARVALLEKRTRKETKEHDLIPQSYLAP